MMFGKKKVKKKWYQGMGIKITGDSKKEVNEAMEYIQKFTNDYEGNCKFLYIFHLLLKGDKK